MGATAKFPLLYLLCTFWLSRAPFSTASYLEVPRLHFAGQFRADPDTRNNINCNFDPKYSISNDTGRDYNINGTGEFSFFHVTVTSAVDETGDFVNDPIINGHIVNNEGMSFPKLVDLDVDYQLIKSSIFGMNFGVKWPGRDSLAFKGDWQLNVIAQDLWSRSICTDVSPDIESHRYGAKSVTRLKGVSWGDFDKSEVLRQLKERVENGSELSVSMSIYFYTRNHPAYLFTNFTLGHVVGTIGIARSNEPTNFNGDRLLSFEGVEQPQDISLTSDDSCFKYQMNKTNHPYWMYKAPFQVYRNLENTRGRLSVDLSNSLPFDLDGKQRNLGNLMLGIMNAEDHNCIELLRTIPYLKDNWLAKTGGVIDYILTQDQFDLLSKSKLVVARVRQPMEVLWDDLEMRTASAFPNLYTACSTNESILEIMLQENPKFIRPINYYVSRLSYNESFKVELLVTNFGEPVYNESVHVFLSNGNLIQPVEGVVPIPPVNTTDKSGVATFTFWVREKIPFPRQYPKKQMCQPPTFSLPIEGQVYMFKYNTSGTCVDDVSNEVTLLTCVNDIAILAFSYVELPPKPNWVDNINSIFSQYDRLYPVMHQMINLANYSAVTLPHNIQLLKYTMGLNISHPGYMPLTRDLSPTKRKMVLNWLDNPIYSKSGAAPYKANASTLICIHPRILAAVDYRDHYFHPPRCTKENILMYDAALNTTEDQLLSLEHVKLPTYFRHLFETNLTLHQGPPPRPLWQFNLKAKFLGEYKQCTKLYLLGQLQLAVELEFATLPVYLTSLYSIVEGCNTEVYQLIRSVIMQEMLHMTQAANILISLGGQPMIDSNKTVPRYPTIGLPGGVLPHLRITLEKLSLVHIYEVFMGIEVPHNTSLDYYSDVIFNNTIGQFYKEIEKCIKQLGDGVFVGRVNEQVKWPWNAPTVGTLHIVTDVQSAIAAIEEIVEEGEGAGPLDPTEGVKSGELAHFYKFEEIVCRRHLVKTTHNGRSKYAYTGPEIAFDQSGVWPMRENPCKDCIPPSNNCYTEAKAFHQAYRALLKKLQSVFSGNPDEIKEAINIMESLAVHARKLMWTKIHDDDYLTCGPVWDYNWDD